MTIAVREFTGATAVADMKAHYARLFARPQTVVPIKNVYPVVALTHAKPKSHSARISYDIPWYWVEDLASIDDTMRRARAIRLRIADRYSVSADELDRKGKGTDARISRVRQEICIALYQEFKGRDDWGKQGAVWNLKRIASLVGGLDHTSVIYYLKKMGVWEPVAKS